jgi:protein gp37
VAETRIEWADFTFNPVWGCTKVSPACDNCYAEAWDKRTGGAHWGPKAPVREFGDKHWQGPLAWNDAAKTKGVRRRVFCASMADVFDNRWPEHVRPKLWRLIRATPHLDWLLLTKRPQNIAKMLPAEYGGWGDGWDNVWLGTTVENQEEADRRIPHLLAVPAKVRFLSCEPLLGPVDIREHLLGLTVPYPRSDALHWVIVGGESGRKARPMQEEWALSLRDQCAAADVPFFFKQWGEFGPTGEYRDGRRFMAWRGKKAAGRLLDGKTYDEFPA